MMRLKKIKRRIGTLLPIEDSHLKPDKIINGYKYIGASRTRIINCSHCGAVATKTAYFHESDDKGFTHTLLERYCDNCAGIYVIPAK